LAALMLVHYFTSDGCDEWDLSDRPVIRAGMPVLIDDDLRFEDERGSRPTTVINKWLRELPVSGASSPRTWRTYAQVLKAWVVFLGARGFDVLGDGRQLRDALSAYAEHRLSGPLEARLAPASWNLAVKTLSAFYTWAAAQGHVDAVPFSYAQRMITRPDGARVVITCNLAAVRGGNAHAARKYLEKPYVDLLMNALAGNDPAGDRDASFQGRETGRNAAVIGLALASGLRAQEHLPVGVRGAAAARAADAGPGAAAAGPADHEGRPGPLVVDRLRRPGPGARLHRLGTRCRGGRLTVAAARGVAGERPDL